MSAATLSRRIVLAGALAAAGSAVAAPTTEPRPNSRSFEVLEVGPGKRFASLTQAGAFMNSAERWNNGRAGAETLSRMRFLVIVSPGPPGYYLNDSGSHSRRWTDVVGRPAYSGQLFGPVVIQGEPGKPPPLLDADGHGDGLLYHPSRLFETGPFDATFRRLAFRGFRRRGGQGDYAAIRLGPAPGGGRVLVEDCEFSDCDNGLMGGAAGQALTLRRCYFHDNGDGTGRTHNINIGPVDDFAAEDLLSTRCATGHLLTTRAAKTRLRNCRLLGAGGAERACLDAPNGGVLQLDGLVCEKSANSDAYWLIHYSGENQDDGGVPFHQPSSVRVSDLTLVAPPRLSRHPLWPDVVGFANQSGAGEEASGRGSRFVIPEARQVRVYGLSEMRAGLPCQVLPARPEIDAASPVRA